jgi:phospholipase/lecithinase/hemolysin
MRSNQSLLARLLIAIAGMALFALSAGSVQAQIFDNLVVFGDSLSDVGNTYQLTGGLAPPNPPYFNGRFSNGPLWVEDLAPKLGLTFNPANDLAFGGARSDTTNNISPLLPGIQSGVGLYVSTHNTLDPNALYTLWGGANDYLFNSASVEAANPNAAVSTTVGNLDASLSLLAAHGAKRFLILNLPDLGSLPAYSISDASVTLHLTSAQVNAITGQHNALLASSLTTLKAANPGDTFTLLDVNSLVKGIEANPGAFGIANATSYYLANPVGDPNSYLFFDGIHPTAAGHSLIANAAFAAVTPEPGIHALLAGMAVFGGCVFFRRRRK